VVNSELEPTGGTDYTCTSVCRILETLARAKHGVILVSSHLYGCTWLKEIMVIQ